MRSTETVRVPSLDEWRNRDDWDQRHDDREHWPQFSAHRSEEEPWRIPRLIRAYALARSLFLLVEKRQIPSGVVLAVRDYKGALTISTVSPEWWAFIEPFMRLAWRGEDEESEKVVGTFGGERWE